MFKREADGVVHRGHAEHLTQDVAIAADQSRDSAPVRGIGLKPVSGLIFGVVLRDPARAGIRDIADDVQLWEASHCACP